MLRVLLFLLASVVFGFLVAASNAQTFEEIPCSDFDPDNDDHDCAVEHGDYGETVYACIGAGFGVVCDNFNAEQNCGGCYDWCRALGIVDSCNQGCMDNFYSVVRVCNDSDDFLREGRACRWSGVSQSRPYSETCTRIVVDPDPDPDCDPAVSDCDDGFDDPDAEAPPDDGGAYVCVERSLLHPDECLEWEPAGPGGGPDFAPGGDLDGDGHADNGDIVEGTVRNGMFSCPAGTSMVSHNGAAACRVDDECRYNTYSSGQYGACGCALTEAFLDGDGCESACGEGYVLAAGVCIEAGGEDDAGGDLGLPPLTITFCFVDQPYQGDDLSWISDLQTVWNSVGAPLCGQLVSTAFEAVAVYEKRITPDPSACPAVSFDWIDFGDGSTTTYRHDGHCVLFSQPAVQDVLSPLLFWLWSAAGFIVFLKRS